MDGPDGMFLLIDPRWEHTTCFSRPFRINNGIFERNKIPLETKVIACLLYLSGLSYRCMTLQTGIIHACYRCVHYGFRRSELT